MRENNERGWRGSIYRQQGEIEQLLADSPSLKVRLNREMLADCYLNAARTVATKYAVKPPARCPFGWTDVLPPAAKKPNKKGARRATRN